MVSMVSKFLLLDAMKIWSLWHKDDKLASRLVLVQIGVSKYVCCPACTGMDSSMP